MPKASKLKNNIGKVAGLSSNRPWECFHHKAYSEIVAYVEGPDQWQTVAVVNDMEAMSAEIMAQFICSLINDRQKKKSVLQAAMKALEAVLDEGLNYSTEQDADEVVANIKLIL